MGGEDGIIYKGIGGFYYVKTPDGQLLECKPRGIFRKQGVKPLPGDRVRLLRQPNAEVIIDEILPRKNALVRPPVANVDTLFIVASTTQPAPSFLVLDKLCAYAIEVGATPVVLVTKTGLAPPDELLCAYRHSGIDALVADAVQGTGLDEVKGRLAGRLNVFCGNSGVGKSTLLNALAPQLAQQVGGISHKLGRGRHTTREVELFEVEEGLVADTPGFASFSLQAGGRILPENVQLCFPEIVARIGQCKFSGCTHLAETGCAVRAAVKAGKMAQSRYQSYVALYEEARQESSRW